MAEHSATSSPQAILSNERGSRREEALEAALRPHLDPRPSSGRIVSFDPLYRIRAEPAARRDDEHVDPRVRPEARLFLRSDGLGDTDALREPLIALDQHTLPLRVGDDAREDVVDLTREFVRERRARRHNRLANSLLEGWISLIVGREPSARLKAFNIANGINAEFEILRVSAFSGIAKP